MTELQQLFGYEYINDQDMERDHAIRNKLIQQRRRDFKAARGFLCDMQIILINLFLRRRASK